MDIKKHITALGFVPKDGTNGIYHKIYVDYAIEIDFETQSINYGSAITAESKTTQNFSQPENFVVLECVDRLLSKGYKPQNIVLEKTWPSGHGTSGRLDICVNREDGTPYMLIECKTYGKEHNKELAKIHKDGGQLFTYFQLEAFRQQLQSAKTTTINQITKKMLDDIVVPLPPIELQNQFADFVNQVDKLKLQMEISLKELEDNFNSLMQKAFKGELF